MPKHRGSDDRKRLDPDDVLAGRAKVTAAELLALIHRVNPTGRELGAREAEQRYALKSRLQSLLVRRFGQELEVVPDPAHDGTVSIRHRGQDRDACHAVLDALDEDARAWVRFQLDIGPVSSTDAPRHPPPAERPSGRGRPPPAEEESPPSADASPDSLLRRADEAIASYDYDRARQMLEQALATSGGAPEPAAALVALLVDTLGDDAGALALPSLLSRTALAHPDVRGLLGLAEARAGDPEQALAWLRGADDMKAADALAALTVRAAAAGDADHAEAHLSEMRRRAPLHPSLVGLSGEITRLRAAVRGPAEAALASLVAAGQEGEAEKKAAEILARWPESEAARRVIRAAEDRRRQAQEAADRRARAEEAAHAAEREAARVSQVRARLGDPDPREGMLGWLGLDASQRRRVEAPGVAELLRWLDLTPARAAPGARVDAVLALAEARRRVHADPQSALDAIEAHEDALERVPEARRLAHDAHAELSARRAARAREEVGAARRDLDAGDAAGALRRLEALAPRELGEGPERAEVEALRAEAVRVVTAERRVGEVERLRQAGQLFDARSLAEALAAESEGEERRRWEEERRAIQETIQRDFRVEIDAEPRPAGEDEPPEGLITAMEPPIWLTGDGRTLVTARGRDRRVRIRIVDVGAAMIRSEILLRTPEPIGNVYLTVVGQVAWLAGQDGALLAFDVERLEVALFRSARELHPAGLRMGQSAIAADERARLPRFYWSLPADAEGYAGAGVQVIDLAQRRVVRELPLAVRIGLVPGARGGRIACLRANGVALYEDRGALADGGRILIRGFPIMCAAVHPSGEGLVLAGTVGGDDDRLALVDAPSEGPPHAPWPVPFTKGLIVTGFVCCLSTGLVTLICLGEEPGYTFVVVRARGGAFEVVHRQDGRGTTSFVTDAGARHVLAYTDDPWRMTPVGPDMPEMPAYERMPSPWIDDVIDAPKCIGSAGTRTEEYEQDRAAVKDGDRASIREMVRDRIATADVERIVDTARAIQGVNAFADEEAARMRDWLWEHRPDVPWVRVYRADDCARLGRWDEVIEALAPCTAASFDGDEDHAQHYHHLLALAALHRDDVQALREHLVEADNHAGSCNLQVLSAMIAAADAGRDEMPEGMVPLAALVWAIRHADARLDAGAAEDALATLDSLNLHGSGEVVQILARQAEAWLRISPGSLRQRFTKIMALAAFVEAHAGPVWAREKAMPIPEATWDGARLDEVAKRASAWLDAQDDGAVQGSP